MHPATLQLAPILAAEKSRVPFYIAGGVLVAWAFIVSMGIGMRRPDFPEAVGERPVIAISAVLVLATASTAVITVEHTAKRPGRARCQHLDAEPGGRRSPRRRRHVHAGRGAEGDDRNAGPALLPRRRQITTTLQLAANPEGNLSYNTKTLTAKAGTVTITMTNMSPLEHNVTIASGSTVIGATPTFKGGARTLSLKLKPGTYTFYCSVPGHRRPEWKAR